MADEALSINDRLAPLKAATPARVFLPAAGVAIATRANLAFALAHAQARDAVEEQLDVAALAQALRTRGLEALCLESAATSRRVYLMRPDLGRRLSDVAAARLAPSAKDCDIVFVIADGLSARAIAEHAPPLLDAALPKLRAAGLAIGPAVVASQGRVAIGDEIAEIVGARIVAVLIGERPGLSSPDSLGIYITYAPRVGRTDAERNCLSNIRRQGMSCVEAAHRLTFLVTRMMKEKMSGVRLKDELSSNCPATRALR